MNILAQVVEASTEPSSAELVVFIIIGALALGSAVSMIMMRNAVHAALMLVLNFFAIAVLYAVNEAQFLATVQIIVYAGAIMVLFLFVIMLLGVDSEDAPARPGRVRGLKLSAVVLGLALFSALAVSIGGPYLEPSAACPAPALAEGETPTGERCQGLAAANEPGNVEAIGSLLFTKYVWPFEVISVLLVIAAIGAMVLGRREEDPADLVDIPPLDPDDGDGADDDDDDDEPVVDSDGDAAPEDAEPASIGQGNPSPSSSPQEDR